MVLWFEFHLANNLTTYYGHLLTLQHCAIICPYIHISMIKMLDAHHVHFTVYSTLCVTKGYVFSFSNSMQLSDITA